MAALPAVFGKLLPVHTLLRISMAIGCRGVGNWIVDDAAFLLAAAIGCARNQAQKR